MQTSKPKTLLMISYSAFAIAIIYHVIYTVSKTQVSTPEAYDMIMLSLAVFGGLLLLIAKYSESHNIVTAVTKTAYIMIPLVIIWYVSIFVLGFFAI